MTDAVNRKLGSVPGNTKLAKVGDGVMEMFHLAADYCMSKKSCIKWIARLSKQKNYIISTALDQKSQN